MSESEGEAADVEATDGSSLQAANRVIVRTAAVFCGAWVFSLLLAIISGDSGLRSPVAALGILALVTVTWFGCLVINKWPPVLLVALLSVTVVAQALDTYPIALAGPYAALVPWINLAVLMAALLVEPVRSLWVIVGISISALLVTIGVSVVDDVLAESWRGCVLMAAYPIAVGMAAYVTARALRKVARADDRASSRRLAVSAEEDRERAGRDERFQISRLLHDTVINTFGAIRDGASSRSPELIRQRCAYDLDVLQSAASLDEDDLTAALSDTNRSPMLDIASSARARATVLGLVLTVTTSGQVPLAPASVASAVRGSIAEALLNVSKHAGTSQVRLSIASTTDSFDIHVRDHGDGGRATREDGGSNPTSITSRCDRAGISACVAHCADGGTDVGMKWRGEPVESDKPSNARPILLESLLPAAKWFSLWLIGLFTVNTLITVGQKPVVGSVVALILLSAAVALAITLGNRGVPIPWYGSAPLAAAAGVVVVSSTAGIVDCDHLGIGWGSMGGTMCIVFLVLLSGQRIWIVAGCISYLAGIAVLSVELMPTSPSCSSISMPAILLTDVAWVIAMILFRRLLVRYGDQAQRSQAVATETMRRVVTMREHERIRTANLRTVLTSIRPLLTGLDDGSIDPNDPVIRQLCGDDESYLRSLIRIDPDLESLGDLLFESVQLARAQGRSMSVRSAEHVSDPSIEILEQVRMILDGVIRTAPPGSEVTVTLFPQPNGATLAVLVPVDSSILPTFGITQTNLKPHLLVTEFVGDDQVLIELEWLTATG